MTFDRGMARSSHFGVENCHRLTARPYGGQMQDPSLHDEQLENEIRLVGDLVLAASQSEDHLSQERIDELLGIDDDAVATEPG